MSAVRSEERQKMEADITAERLRVEVPRLPVSVAHVGYLTTLVDSTICV